MPEELQNIKLYHFYVSQINAQHPNYLKKGLGYKFFL